MATGIGNLPYVMTPVSPFDVITSQAQNERIANIEALADGTGIGDNAVTEAKSAIKSSYSTTEVDTGRKWIDGRPVYKKVINFGALPNATIKTVPHGITNLGYVISMEGFASNGSVQFLLPRSASTGATDNIDALVNGANVQIQVAVNRSSYTTCFFVLHYVKSA